MKRKTYFFVCIVLGFLPAALRAQSDQIIPVSPEAAALTKMVDYPVNYNTGVPNISIPFYEINVGGLRLPITLNYHSGGFKINEQATRVGLGWSLSSDLQITRTVNGLDDFKPSVGYIANPLTKAYYPSGSTCPSCPYPIWSTSPFPYSNAYDLATGVKDGMPDKFTYKLLNKSGSFYVQKNSAGTGYTIVPVPYSNIKISYSNGQFTIVDTDGTVYLFGEQGAIDIGNQAISKKEVSGRISTGTCLDCVVTTWKCKKIMDNNQSNEINFTYVTKSVARFRTYNDYIEYYDNQNPCNLFTYYTSDDPPINTITDYDNLVMQVPFYQISSPKYMEVVSSSTQRKFHVPYLDANDYVVDKVYTQTVSALPGSSIDVAGLSVSEIVFRGGKVQFSGTDALTSIKVLDSKNTDVKSIHLFHSYENALYTAASELYNGVNFQGTRYLDSLHVRNGSTTFDRYAFLYGYKFCFGNHLKGHDAWGYPNFYTAEIASSQGDMMSIPGTDVNQSIFYRDIYGGCMNFASDIKIHIGGGIYRETVDNSIMQAGILKRIIYPTGGYVDFDFEANQYLEEFTNGDETKWIPQRSGGLRIRSISYYEAGSTIPETQKYYRYGELEDGNGLLINRPNFALQSGVYHYESVSYKQRLVYLHGPSSTPCSNRSCLGIETIEDKTTYQAASSIDYTYSDGAPIYYTKVTEYKQDLGIQSGKTEYEYYLPEEFQDWPAPLIEESRIPETNIAYLKTSGLMGAQKAISTYKYVPNEYNSNTGFQLVHRKRFEFTRYLRPEQIQVAYAFLRVQYQLAYGNYSGTNRDLYNNAYSFMASSYDPGVEYLADTYGIPVGTLLLSKETEQWFEEGGVDSVVKDYYYDDLPYLQVSRIISNNAKGEMIRKSLKYSYDLNGVYGQMENLNMISQVIEETVDNLTLGVDVSRNLTTYGHITTGLGFYAPTLVQSSVKGEGLITDITFDEYGQYGNILQLTGRDGIPVSYLWGYTGLYPVAQLKGVYYANIPSTYKSNSGIINPQTDATLRGILTNLRNAISSDKVLDTYTYKRLVGMTSQTAPNEKITYYEYDPIGRLTAQKDHNQSLVSSYDYQTVGPSAYAINSSWAVNTPMMQTHWVIVTTEHQCPTIISSPGEPIPA